MGKPLFKRLVEIGRVALINNGDNRGKLVVILDVIDQNKALVDGPGVVRQSTNFRNLSLTGLKVKIGRGAREASVKKAFAKAEIVKKWESTSWAKKIASRRRRTELNDFDRFKLVLLRKKRASIVNTQVRKLKKAYNKDLTSKKKTHRALTRTMQ